MTLARRSALPPASCCVTRGRNNASSEKATGCVRGHVLLFGGAGLKDEAPHPIHRGSVRRGAQERKRTPLAGHGVRMGRKRDVPTSAAAVLPDGEADRLHVGGQAGLKVELGVGDLVERVAAAVNQVRLSQA